MKLININFLCECLTIELNIKNKLCVLVVLHWSPSQSRNKFSCFTDNLTSTLQDTTWRKSFLTMVLGDFNAKSKLWFDQENTSCEGIIMNDLMTQYSLSQAIHDQRT